MFKKRRNKDVKKDSTADLKSLYVDCINNIIFNIYTWIKIAKEHRAIDLSSPAFKGQTPIIPRTFS